MTNFVHTDDYDQNPERQLEDMKRLVVLLMNRLGTDRIEIGYDEIYESQLQRAEIVIWPDRMTDKLMVAVRTPRPDEPVDTETLNDAIMGAVREALTDG